MRKLNRYLAVILTALMLLSIIPMSISTSAADPIALSKTDPLVKIVAPTITPSEFDYGLSYGDLTLSGGEVYYDGELVKGYFAFTNTSTVPIPRENFSVSLYFYPEDTTKYKSRVRYSSTTSSPIENWPTITVKAVEAELQSTATALAIDPGAQLYTATITGTVINKKTGEAIEGGKWSYDYIENVQRSDKKVLESGTYSATWTCTGYTDVTATVQVNVNDTGTPPSGISVYPTVLDDDIVYSDALIWDDIKFEGGRVLYEGQVITGTFKWQRATKKIGGTVAQGTVYFAPDNAELASFFTQSAQMISLTVSVKPAPLNVKAPLPIEIVQGSVTASTTADKLLGFEFDEGINTAKVNVKFSKNLATLEVGTYNDITTTISYANHETVEVTLPIKIVPPKKIPITKIPEAATVTWGNTLKYTAAERVGFEFEEGFDASKVMVEWGVSIKDLPLGRTEPMELRIYIDANYEEIKVTLPLEIVKRPDSSKFCYLDCRSYNSNNEGKVQVAIAFHDQYKNGTATVKLTDGTNTYVLAENIPTTYVAGEKSKSKILTFQIPEYGSYSYKAIAEYTPGDADTIYYTNPIVESYELKITYKPWRTMTCINTRYSTDTLQVYEGKQISVSTSLSKDEFAYWEILDANGNKIDPSVFGLTEEKMKMTSMSFYITIDADFTIAARDKFYIPPIVKPDQPDEPDEPDTPIEPENPDDPDTPDTPTDPGTELSLWEKIVAFFQNLFSGIGSDGGECPVLKWICRIIELIVAFFTGFFNGLVSK